MSDTVVYFSPYSGTGEEISCKFIAEDFLSVMYSVDLMQSNEGKHKLCGKITKCKCVKTATKLLGLWNFSVAHRRSFSRFNAI